MGNNDSVDPLTGKTPMDLPHSYIARSWGWMRVRDFDDPRDAEQFFHSLYGPSNLSWRPTGMESGYWEVWAPSVWTHPGTEHVDHGEIEVEWENHVWDVRCLHRGCTANRRITSIGWYASFWGARDAALWHRITEHDQSPPQVIICQGAWLNYVSSQWGKPQC